jgi:hypothetical protein
MNSLACLDNCRKDRSIILAQNVPSVRIEKISSVKRQIYEGRYSVDEKLEATVDRILEYLLQSK